MKQIYILIPLILLAACANKKPVVVPMPRVVSALSPIAADLDSVRYGENLKAYSFGRYVDPNDGFVMHEAHTVYRVETTAKWNLHPNVLVSVPGGPVVGIIDSAHKNSPITPEIIAEMNRQKTATAMLLEQGERVDQTINQLSKTISSTAQIASENVRLKDELTTTERRLAILEADFRKPPTEATFTKPVIPSVKGTNVW
jgi:hypothetical protein